MFVFLTTTLYKIRGDNYYSNTLLTNISHVRQTYPTWLAFTMQILPWNEEKKAKFQVLSLSTNSSESMQA